jgi:pSer/pThr/pTyr-binding forkhead associated (FHA) protein
MATIELLFKEKNIDKYSIGAGDSLLIGRNSVNDIVIDNLAVSAQHAKIESIGNEFLFVDLHSENGSYVNDEQTKSHWLNDGDIITVGKHTLAFSNPSESVPEKIRQFGNTKTMRIDTQRFRELLKENNQNKEEKPLVNHSNAPETPDRSVQIGVLSYLTGKKQNIQLNAKIIRIGKDMNSDIRVKGFGVGKTAVVINRMPDGWYINYVEGIAKLKVNNNPINKSAKLENLDILKIGSTKMQFLIFG